MRLLGELANLGRLLSQRQVTKPAGPFPSSAWAWPTGGRDLLLRAAALPDLNQAAAAYDQWQRTVEFETATMATQRLLVAVSYRMPEGILPAVDRARLKGVERKLWSLCIISLKSTEPALAALHREKIDVMVLKGAVRTVLDVSDLRGRFASDLDLLVRPTDFGRAWDAIVGAGWTYRDGQPPDLLRLIGANLKRGDLGELDLHRYPYHQLIRSDAEPTGLWARARLQEFMGHPVFVPSPTDRLLMAIAHGAIGGHEQSDWLVDSALLIHGGEVDWDLFLTLARERGIEANVAVVLSYLAGPLEAPVPVDVLEGLARYARRHPFRHMGALLQARPKREHSIVSGFSRGGVRAVRMLMKNRMIRHLEGVRRAGGNP